MKNKITTILLSLAFLVGLSLLLYPTVSDYWNSIHASKAVAEYSEEVNHLSKAQYEEIWDAATKYNEKLKSRGDSLFLTKKQERQYASLLDVNGTGVMGYIEIPSIKVSLPIYHGTDDSVLQIAVGHLDWSSLPVGGDGTHCVLSGHRGLPSAKLFTNLDQLVEGDTFILRVLNEELTYQVDQILIVEPENTDDLKAEYGKDLCTLVTCTPYGVNSHRLLVRGHRIENTKQTEAVRVTSDAMQIEPVLVAPAIALPILFVLLIGLLITGNKKKTRGGKRDDKA